MKSFEGMTRGGIGVQLKFSLRSLVWFCVIFLRTSRKASMSSVRLSKHVKVKVTHLDHLLHPMWGLGCISILTERDSVCQRRWFRLRSQRVKECSIDCLAYAKRKKCTTNGGRHLVQEALWHVHRFSRQYFRQDPGRDSG
jgi:hypothetical protein